MPDTKPNAAPHEEWLLSQDEWLLARIEQWLGLVRREIYGAFALLEVSHAKCENPRDLEAWRDAAFRPLDSGAQWGEAWDYAWFRFKGTIPGDWTGEAFAARIDLGGEAGVIGPEGEFCQRLTHGSVFDHWCEVDEVPLHVVPGESVSILAQAWASNLDGVGRPIDPDWSRGDYKGKHAGILRRAEIVEVRSEVRALHHDIEVLLGLARRCPEYAVRRKRILRALRESMLAWADDPANAVAARAALAPELSKPASASAPVAVSTGHAHIDSAWMWRLCDSIGKCGRTFAHQLAYMERYPDYVFGASTALHYVWTKKYFPKTYARLKERVAEGRWEIQGAMWVEPDTNVPSGESLIRQFLYGAAFFEEAFGLRSPIAWLPDVFGLSGCLPQIFARCGVQYFVTKKPNWGRDNAFKKTAFRWVGNDGSEVLAHLLPQVRDYNGRMESDYLYRASEGFVESDRLNSFLYTFGVGDGGGGPTEPMLERAERMKDLEGLPKVRHGRVDEVFTHFEDQRELLDAHHGEIYVEGHRGTYTTQGCLKRMNRRLEIRLTHIEQLYAASPAAEYPKAELEAAWKRVLTNQFHDILPGSGIREVIEDAMADYAEAEATCEALESRWIEALPDAEGRVGFHNALNDVWAGALEMANAPKGLPAQLEPDGRVAASLVLNPGPGPALELAAEVPEVTSLTEPVLENAHLRCVFNANGEIESLIHKADGREWARDGRRGNQLRLYVDRPVDWDAWDVDRFYREECVGSAEAAGEWTGWTGPARSVLEFNLKVGGSTLRQRCVLAADSPRIDFETVVDWSERHKMLRVGFETPLQRGQLRTSVQHGFVDRPLSWNNSQEAAKFEVPCQRWAALIDGECGMALLNDSKHGIRGEGRLIELALLRASTFPDYDGDQGRHRFTYAFMPFEGDPVAAGVAREADRLNVLPLFCTDKDTGVVKPPVHIEGPATIECMKYAESGDGIVLRLANPTDRTVEVTITPASGKPLAEVDGLEREEGIVQSPLRLAPFQFRSFKFE